MSDNRMSDTEKLDDLCAYLDRLAEYSEKPVTQIKDHDGLRYHEAALVSRTGIHFNLADEGEGPVWMEIERLPRQDPPAPDDTIANWIKLSNDPAQRPDVLDSMTVTVAQEQAQAWLDAGKAREDYVRSPLRDDAAPNTRDVTLFLADDPDTRAAVDSYLNDTWHPWAASEAPRRETMAIYDQFFALQQSIETAGSEHPRELVWGIGVARWETQRGTFDIPLLQCRVEIEVDDATGALRIRPRQPGVGGQQNVELNITPFEAKEIDGVQPAAQAARTQLERLEQRGEEVSPFGRSQIEPILRAVVTNLDTQGQYRPVNDHDPDDRSLPEINDRLQVTDTWVVFSRQRPSNFLRTDLENLRGRIKDATEDEEKLPNVARRLVNKPPDDPSKRPVFDLSPGFNAPLVSEPEGDREAEEPEAFFFPKPFNEDQQAIVRRLTKQDGVVVQGPPGTGKTHTIANLISHYMATGQRVLVVSRGAAALSVLRDQIPEGIRELTISLLSNDREGLRQLENAVRLLADETATLDPYALNKDIQNVNQRILDLDSRIQKTDREIKSWAEAHAHRIEVSGGRSMLPTELASYLMQSRESYDWFTDRPDPGEVGDPDVTDHEMAELADARRRLGADLVYLDAHLPEPENLPDGPTLEALHGDLVEAAELAERTRNQRIPQLAASVEDAAGRARAMADALDALLDAHDVLADAPWLEDAYKGWISGERDELQEVYDELLHEIVELAKERPRYVRAQVEIPRPALSDPDVRAGLQRMVGGRRPFPPLAVTKGSAKRYIARCRVDGQPPQSADDARLLLDYIDWRGRIDGFIARWQKIAAEFGLPEPPEDGLKAGHWLQEQRQKVDAVDNAGGVYCDVIAPDLETLYPTGATAGEVLRDRETAQRMRDAARLSLSRHGLEASRARVREIRETLNVEAGEIGERLRHLLESRLGDPSEPPESLRQAWEDARAELRRLRDRVPDMNRVREMTARIEAAGAPAWAQDLRSQPAGPDGNAGIPGDWREAWRWAQLQTVLQRLDGRAEMQRLTEHRQELWREYEQAFAEVVRLRTYMGLYNRMTDPIRSALQQFTAAMRRIGKGKGTSAPRHRRAARRAMEECYSAVPVWIMPEWRVSESLPADLGLFDLVIIDEASQSDVRALPAVLRGKKVLCVGDEKQVTPVSPGFPDSYMRQLEHNYLRNQVYGSEMLPGSSFYELMGSAFPGERIMLKEHFRCVEPIIRFSSREFYDDKIRPMRVPRPSERLDPPLIDILVPHGSRGAQGNSKVNKAEADVIVAEIARMVEDPAMAGRRIGVISLVNDQQARHIQRRLLNTIGEAKYREHGILCGDAATFQGSEADVVFLSMVVAGKVTAVTATMYQQRFNVALSRAKDRMILVRSVPDNAFKNPADMKVRAVQHFRDPMPQDNKDLGDLSEWCDSELEREVYRRLHADGYNVRPQVPAGGYRIDLVVEGENDARLAIEMDGDLYHGPEVWWQDFQRQLALERVGWRFWRCWGSSWTLDPDACYADLVDTLTGMGIEPVGDQPGGTASLHTARRIVLTDGSIRQASDEEMATGAPDSEPEKDADSEEGARAETDATPYAHAAAMPDAADVHHRAASSDEDRRMTHDDAPAESSPATERSTPDRATPWQQRLDIGVNLDPQAEIDFTAGRSGSAGSARPGETGRGTTAQPAPNTTLTQAASATQTPGGANENKDFFGDEETEELIEIGDEVTLVYDDQPQRPIVVRISANDDEPEKGILHRNKPLSQALLGNAAEDVVEVPLDRGTRTATILRVVKLDEAI